MSSRTPKQRREHKRKLGEMLADLRDWAQEHTRRGGNETPDVHAVVNPNQVYGGGWLIRASLNRAGRIELTCTRLEEAIAEWQARQKERAAERQRNQELAERN